MNDVLEAIGRALLEVLLELALKGPGYLIARCFHQRSQFEPDGCLVVSLGISFWIVVGLTIAGIVILF